MASHITGSTRVQYIFAFRNLAVRHGLAENLGNIIPDGFGQAGGVDRYDLRLINRKNIMDRLQQVRLASEHGGPFRKGTGGGHDWLPVVTGQCRPVIGVTPLGAVAMGETAVNAQGSIHGPYGLAGLGRINGQRFSFCDISSGVCRSNIFLVTLIFSCQLSVISGQGDSV